MSSAPAPVASPEKVKWFPGPGMSAAQPARRKHQRFPITAHAEYVMAGSRAHAMTRNMSSGEILLTTQKTLRVGEAVKVLIDWSVLLEGRCHLRLVIFGKVLRSDRTGTAVGFTRYEFRIRPQDSSRLSA
jgi:hypothetical protein